MAPSGLVPASGQVSAGSVGLFESCRASAAYDLAETLPPKPRHWWGIFLHRFLEYVNTRDVFEAVVYVREKCPRILRTALAVDVSRVPAGMAEVALAHDLVFDEVRRLHYPARSDPRSELYSRPDLVYVDRGLRFVDWKSGRPWPDADPATDEQMLGVAAALWRWRGAVPRGGYGFVESSGHIVFVEHSYSEQELLAFEDRGRRALSLAASARRDAVSGLEVAFSPGEHCQWCHLSDLCPSALRQR